MHPDGICCESQETGKRKPNAAKQQSLDFFQSCLQDMAAFCRAPVFHHSKIKTIPTRECRKCHSKIDPRSKDCPICGDYTSDQSIVIPNVRPLGKCSTCQTVCYERCCSICGEKIQADWGSACNEREPLTWTNTPLRVRTPTGSPPPAPRVVSLPACSVQAPVDQIRRAFLPRLRAASRRRRLAPARPPPDGTDAGAREVCVPMLSTADASGNFGSGRLPPAPRRGVPALRFTPIPSPSDKGAPPP